MRDGKVLSSVLKMVNLRCILEILREILLVMGEEVKARDTVWESLSYR